MMSNSQRVNLEPVFVLHSHAYSNSSLIIELLTYKHGRMAAVARSARGPKSRYRGKLQLFTPLLASWIGRGELKTLGNLELSGRAYQLDGDVLLCGFYLNELLMRLLQRVDPYPNLFTLYQDTLNALEQGENLPKTLRIFEKRLLQALGYGLSLVHDADSHEPIDSKKHYQYLPERGFVCSAQDNSGLILPGSSLLALEQEDFSDSTSLQDAKKLLRCVLARHLGSKPLKSRELLR